MRTRMKNENKNESRVESGGEHAPYEMEKSLFYGAHLDGILPLIFSA